MPLFVLHCLDRSGGLPARLAARDAHLAYARESGKVRLGGPLLDAQDQPVGSLLVIEADDQAGAEAFAAADPYNQAGVFERVEIRSFRVSLGAL
jgi:uncharacterized protein YciI